MRDSNIQDIKKQMKLNGRQKCPKEFMIFKTQKEIHMKSNYRSLICKCT